MAPDGNMKNIILTLLVTWPLALAAQTPILVNAYSDNAATDSAGVIHLFASNGALLNTITNPQPTDNAEFGYSLAVVGNDRFVAFQIPRSLRKKITSERALQPTFSPDFCL
jgi:hypothetical protein